MHHKVSMFSPASSSALSTTKKAVQVRYITVQDNGFSAHSAGCMEGAVPQTDQSLASLASCFQSQEFRRSDIDFGCTRTTSLTEPLELDLPRAE